MHYLGFLRVAYPSHNSLHTAENQCGILHDLSDDDLTVQQIRVELRHMSFGVVACLAPFGRAS